MLPRRTWRVSLLSAQKVLLKCLYTRDSLGADTAMGRVGADSIAVLDRALTRPDRAGAYDYPHHDRAVLRQPSRQAWREAAQRATGFGDVFAAFWRRTSAQCTLPCDRHRGCFSRSH